MHRTSLPSKEIEMSRKQRERSLAALGCPKGQLSEKGWQEGNHQVTTKMSFLPLRIGILGKKIGNKELVLADVFDWICMKKLNRMTDFARFVGIRYPLKSRLYRLQNRLCGAHPSLVGSIPTHSRHR